jgi:putative RecB family exonuclease
MRSCPKKFELQYVLAARPDHQPSSLLFGGAIHSALELHFRLVMEGLAATPEALLSAYHDAWREQRRAVSRDVPVRFNAGEDQGKLDALADRLIRAFLASGAATPNGTILGVEEELTIVLDDDVPDVLARVDLVVQSDDALHVTDYKTSRSRWSEGKAIESAEQLQLYAAGVRRMGITCGAFTNEGSSPAALGPLP